MLVWFGSGVCLLFGSRFVAWWWGLVVCLFLYCMDWLLFCLFELFVLGLVDYLLVTLLSVILCGWVVFGVAFTWC